jgi:phage tail-like protein
MSVPISRVYRFATAAQWNTCLFSGADRSTPGLAATVQPTAPYSDQPLRFASRGARATGVSAVGEFLWRGDDGALLRAFVDDDAPIRVTAPQALAQSSRIVVTSDALWTAGTTASSLECFELDSLSRRLVVDLAPRQVVDLDRDGRDALIVLLQRGSEFECVHVDENGAISEIGPLSGVPALVAMANLPKAGQLLVLGADRRTLYGFARGESTANFVLPLGTLHPCFRATALGSDARLRFFVGGVEDSQFGGTSRLLVLDVDGLRVAELLLDAEPTGVAGNATTLLVGVGAGLCVYRTTQVAANSGASVCKLITPALASPRGDAPSRWLRAEIWASLPTGTMLEIAYAATDDDALRNQAQSIAGDASVPVSARMSGLQALLGNWSTPVVFRGSDSRAQLTDTTSPLAAPLFDATAGNLWVNITLSAAPGAPLPELSRLDVRYSGHTLLEQLPMIYRRDAATSGSFLRRLVGVLESTTQETDRRIGSMGSLIHPDTAPVPWLDFLAGWLGLPWDDGLSDEQKRAIAHNAPTLAAARGTRRGLETLLDCLLPGEPKRYSITDVDVDHGFAMLGGPRCEGSRLPAQLSGLPNSAAILSTKTILGRARLPCPGEVPDTTSRFLGQLRINIAATAGQRAAWSPWIRALIVAMVPASMQLGLCWRSPALRSNELIAEGLELLPAPVPHLGADAITGYARLPPSPKRLM